MEQKRNAQDKPKPASSGAEFFGPRPGALADDTVGIVSAQDCTGLLQTPADPAAAETLLALGSQPASGIRKKQPQHPTNKGQNRP